METVTDFIFLGSEITADGDCSHEIKRCLLLQKKQEISGKTSTSASLTTLKFLTVDHNIMWKILKEIGITDHLICLLRNLYAGQEATVRTRHGTRDWFQIGKAVMSRLCIVTLLI